MGYKNGAVPKSALSSLDGQPGAHLVHSAANAYNRAKAEIKKKTGINISVVGWNRTLQEQKNLFFSRYKVQLFGRGPYGDVRWYRGKRYVRVSGAAAARPGTSNHGWGLAIDIANFGGVGNFNHPNRSRALPILRKHGFSDTEGRKVGEPWHFVHKSSLDRGKKQKKQGLRDVRFSPLTDEVQIPTGKFEGRNKWSSREDNEIVGAVVHHHGTIGDSGRVRLVESNDPASANYIIMDSGHLIGSVPEKYRAWTSGSFDVDKKRITIEVQNATGAPEWRISNAAMNSLVRLLNELGKRYKFTPNSSTVEGHRDFASTACPGPYLYPRLPQVATAARKGNTGAWDSEQKSSSSVLKDDGWWGSSTTRALQLALGTPSDGVVSSQDVHWKSSNPGLTTGWRWTGNPRGSRVIFELQMVLRRRKKYKGKLDGLIGPKTIRALQSELGTPVDGKVSKKSAMVKALQRDLRDGKF